ncbi:MAG: hypothetical protein IAE80_23795 [Anaerolinea sp.]|nr:hypothetical protein [Anaerolinea sp.]
MKKLLLSLMAISLIALVSILPVHAQQAVAIDYQIRNISRTVSGDDVIVQFEVTNLGDPVDTPVTAWLLTADTEEALDSVEVPPLPTGENLHTVTLSFSVSRFPPGTVQRLVATLGVRDLPPTFEGQANIARFTVTMPPPIDTGLPAQAAPPAGSGFSLPVDLDGIDPLTAAVVVAGIGIVLILIWLLTIIIRVLFERPPTFPQWQVPYALNPYIDQSSTEGRRQLWQQHAQNDMPPLPCQAGAYAASKQLIGTDGKKLSGWRVTALRLSQYDMYGRVNRSTIVADRSTTARIDRAVRRSAKLDQKNAERAVRGAVKRLTDHLFKSVNKRNLMLPVALDMRLRGAHGDVQIQFRLDQCVGGAWQRLDEWKPELVVTSGHIQENFTYTFFGKKPEEKPRAFRARLRAEVTGALAGLVCGKNPPPAAPQTSPAMPAMLAPMPADTTPIQPVEVSDATAANQSAV